MSQYFFCWLRSQTQRLRNDNKNKICVFQGGGAWGAEKQIVSKTLFSWGDAMTREFWKCQFYCLEILLSLRRLLQTVKVPMFGWAPTSEANRAGEGLKFLPKRPCLCPSPVRSWSGWAWGETHTHTTKKHKWHGKLAVPHGTRTCQASKTNGAERLTRWVRRLYGGVGVQLSRRPKENKLFGQEISGTLPWASSLSGPLNRVNAILSLLQPLDRCRTPSAVGSAIGWPYLASTYR